MVGRYCLYFSSILVNALDRLFPSPPPVYKLSVEEEEKFVILIKSITSQQKVQIEDVQMVSKELVYDM